MKFNADDPDEVNGAAAIMERFREFASEGAAGYA
jgi:hypothetical protein